MELTPVYYFRAVCKKLHNLRVWGLLAVLAVAWCVEGGDQDLDYCLSPYTDETIQFFSITRPIFSFHGKLKTVQIGTETHILKKQSELIEITLKRHTVDSIPDRFVQGIEFSHLKIGPAPPDGPQPSDMAVLNKILAAFVTISAETLELHGPNLVSEGFGRAAIQSLGAAGQRAVSGILGRLGMPENAPKCILKTHNIRLSNVYPPTIKWLQERIDLSQCQTNLAIRGPLSLDNLELLDGFNAAGIGRLALYKLCRLGSLECKLLREGPFPDILVIDTHIPAPPGASPQILHNIAQHHWKGLHIHQQIWEGVVNSAEDPKRLRMENLTIGMDRFSANGEPSTSLFSRLGDSQTTTRELVLKLQADTGPATPPLLIHTLEWVSRCFRGLEHLTIDAKATPNDLISFIADHQLEMTTNPTLTYIQIGKGVRWFPAIAKQKKTMLSLSLEAWELCTAGKLARELAQTQTNLDQLSSEEQEMITLQRWIASESEFACATCKSTLADLKETTPAPDICILDHPLHWVCSNCLGHLPESSTGSVSCPVCRGSIRHPFLTNRIEKNSQGRFELTMAEIPDPRPVLSFPSTNFEELVGIYQKNKSWFDFGRFFQY
ncbi:hypothetical protein NEDG_01013 [Nematocida displodere]|uniref:RING-type domain-containing protein n=1 Tax=Nematocida displodere TaxID=1805483 RepID=A0A177EAA8_9MICR|nr:hypothetical protein NEDG_01013 [Nematocida displodere]